MCHPLSLLLKNGTVEHNVNKWQKCLPCVTALKYTVFILQFSKQYILLTYALNQFIVTIIY